MVCGLEDNLTGKLNIVIHFAISPHSKGGIYLSLVNLKRAGFSRIYFSVKSISVSVKTPPFRSFITRWIVLLFLGYCAK